MTSPRLTKSQGQWALGHREPLNPNEQFKQDDDALNVRDRILNQYSNDRLRQHREERPARTDALGRALHPA